MKYEYVIYSKPNDSLFGFPSGLMTLAAAQEAARLLSKAYPKKIIRVFESKINGTRVISIHTPGPLIHILYKYKNGRKIPE